MSTWAEIAEGLLLSDALTPMSEHSDEYIVHVDNLEYLVKTVFDLAGLLSPRERRRLINYCHHVYNLHPDCAGCQSRIALMRVHTAQEGTTS